MVFDFFRKSYSLKIWAIFGLIRFGFHHDSNNLRFLLLLLFLMVGHLYPHKYRGIIVNKIILLFSFLKTLRKLILFIALQQSSLSSLNFINPFFAFIQFRLCLSQAFSFAVEPRRTFFLAKLMNDNLIS